jgi:hypothetical protein
MKEGEEMPELEAEYAQGRPRMGADSLHLSAADLGQNCPTCCPQHCPHPDDTEVDSVSEPFGKPLSITEVAVLIGVSAWTIRHRYLAAGLPYFRVGPTGKLLFYKNQIIHWLLTEQRKGGIIP